MHKLMVLFVVALICQSLANDTQIDTLKAHQPAIDKLHFQMRNEIVQIQKDHYHSMVSIDQLVENGKRRLYEQMGRVFLHVQDVQSEGAIKNVSYKECIQHLRYNLSFVNLMKLDVCRMGKAMEELKYELYDLCDMRAAVIGIPGKSIFKKDVGKYEEEEMSILNKAYANLKQFVGTKNKSVVENSKKCVFELHDHISGFIANATLEFTQCVR